MNEMMTIPPSEQVTNTLFLSHFDGTSIVDELGNSVRIYGNRYNDTASKKFGARSLTNEVRTTGNAELSSVLPVDNSDFTVEFWYKCLNEGNSGSSTLFSCGSFRIQSNAAATRLYTYTPSGNVSDITPSSPFLGNNFVHIAVVRNNDIYKVFTNGNLRGTPLTDSVPINGNYITILQGVTTPTNNPRKEWIDELRISKIARYSENFTPQTTPFEVD